MYFISFKVLHSLFLQISSVPMSHFTLSGLALHILYFIIFFMSSKPPVLFLDSLCFYIVLLDVFRSSFCFIKYLFRFGKFSVKIIHWALYLACYIFLAPYFCLNGFNILVFYYLFILSIPCFFLFYLNPLNIHILYSFW